MSTEVLHGPEVIPAADGPLQSATPRECIHEPRCPAPYALDRDAAHAIACHPEQGWSLLCNGVVLFDDTGDILPDGHCTHARRADLTAAARHRHRRSPLKSH